jgi:hypothetical protein
MTRKRLIRRNVVEVREVGVTTYRHEESIGSVPGDAAF